MNGYSDLFERENLRDKKGNIKSSAKDKICDLIVSGAFDKKDVAQKCKVGVQTVRNG